MDAPDWATQILTWLTALTLAVILAVNVVKEYRRRRRERRERLRPPLLSLAFLLYLANSVVEDWRRFLKLLWDAAESTASLAGRVGVLVIVAMTVFYGLTLPASVPDWGWLPGVPVGIVGAGAVCAIAYALTNDPPNNEPAQD